MKTSIVRAGISFLILSCWAVVLGLTTPVLGNDTDVIQIEEHWQLNVGGPDVGRTAPQVTMIMSPTNTLDGAFFCFTLNHWSYPDFESGGYQLQLWQGEKCVDVKHGAHSNSFASDGETITWVQRLPSMREVSSFRSSTERVSLGAISVTKDSALDDSVAIDSFEFLPTGNLTGQSGIGYAGNRVSSLTLTRLRWVTKDGEQHEMVAPIDIDTDLD